MSALRHQRTGQAFQDCVYILQLGKQSFSHSRMESLEIHSPQKVAFPQIIVLISFLFPR